MARNYSSKIAVKKSTTHIKQPYKPKLFNKHTNITQNQVRSIKNETSSLKDHQILRQTNKNITNVKKIWPISKKRTRFSLTDLSDDENDLNCDFDISVGGADKQISDLISKIDLELLAEENELIKGQISLVDDPLIKNLNLDNEVQQSQIDGFTDDFELANKILDNLTSKSKDYATNPDKTNKVHMIYSEIAQYMKSYKSGKLPKALSMLPKLENWEELLQLTQPKEWSKNAIFQTIKTFVGTFSNKQADKYFSMVLLPAVRLDILQNKALNCHLYMALKKAMYKPGAWIKSILLPLCKDGCTYKEASIIGSVLRRVSIPMMYAAAAIVCICNCSNWYGSTSYLLTVLLGKKFALPKQAIEVCITYFNSFTKSEQMPVIWHQSLLTLVMLYKDFMTCDQIEKLKSLCKCQVHQSITPQILSHLTAEATNDMHIDH